MDYGGGMWDVCERGMRSWGHDGLLLISWLNGEKARLGLVVTRPAGFRLAACFSTVSCRLLRHVLDLDRSFWQW